MNKPKPRCSCCERGGILRNCTGCYEVSYCSEDCQRKDWIKRHRDTCKKRVQPNVHSPNVNPNLKQQAALKSTINRIEDFPFDTPPSHASSVHTASTANAFRQETGDSSLGNAHAHCSHSTSSPAVQKRDEKDKLAKMCFTCKSTIHTKFCSGCKKIYYCSTQCQRDDWGRHKLECVMVEGSMETERCKRHQTMGKHSSKVNPNQKQQAASETGIDRIEHLPFDTPPSHAGSGHTASTANAFKQETGDSSLGNAHAQCSHSTSSPAVQKRDEKDELTKMCFTCKSTIHTKFCSGCKKIYYCSTQCQRDDWGRHKLECIKVEGKIETDGFKRHQAMGNAASNNGIATDWSMPNLFGSFPFVFPGMFTGMDDFSGMFTGMDDSTRPRPTQSFREAKRIVQRMYPLHQIISDFEELPIELFFGPPLPTNRVMLALMTRVYPHPFGRRAMYIQDENGEESYCIFYLEVPIPFPYFSWDDIRPGRYICIEEAFIHGFLDGTVGIRIEDPSCIRVLTI